MSVAVPPPVAAIFRVLPSSTPGTCVRACVTPPGRPSAVRAAALLLDSVRSLSEPVFSVIWPPVIVEGVDEPVRPSIFASRPVTSLLTLISFGSLPVAFAATKVSVLPLTVMVSPTAKPFDSEAAVPSPTLSLVAPAKAPAVTAPPPRVAVLAAPALISSAASAVPVTSEVGGRTGPQGDDAARCRRRVGRGCVARQGVDRRHQIAQRGADTQRIGVARTDEAIRAGFEGDRLAVDNQRVGSSDRNGEGRQKRRSGRIDRAGRLELAARRSAAVLVYAARCGDEAPVNAALIES